MGETALNIWMIAAAVLAVACAVLAAVCIQKNNRLKISEEQAVDAEELRREIRVVRGEDVLRRREIAALHRALDDEQDRSDAILQELENVYEQARAAHARAEQAEARRIRAEKEVYAIRMRTDLLEKQISQLNQELSNQEKLYQDILRERDNQIARLQEGQSKRRVRKKPDVLDQQVSLEDLLGGM